MNSIKTDVYNGVYGKTEEKSPFVLYLNETFK